MPNDVPRDFATAVHGMQGPRNKRRLAGAEQEQRPDAPEPHQLECATAIIRKCDQYCQSYQRQHDPDRRRPDQYYEYQSGGLHDGKPDARPVRGQIADYQTADVKTGHNRESAEDSWAGERNGSAAWRCRVEEVPRKHEAVND